MVRLLLIAMLWLTPLWAQAAAVVAQLDRNPVALGDPVVLTFTADGIVSGDPDFTPLHQDFELRGQSQSNSFNMVNGVSRVHTEWELHLYPLKTGTVHIPSIQFGSDKSQALDLQVLDQPAPAAGNAPDIFIELAAEPKQPYVQQETIITQRMYHIVQLQPQASLTHPSVESGKGDIQQIGNTVNTTAMRNGRNYQVIERRYALIPQQSGPLTLGRTTFEGILAEPGPGRFDPFGLSGKPIRRFSQPLALQVREQPASYTGKQWLPARSVTLNAHWQTPPDKLKAGEPVTLTLAIVADGLAAEQLPKLEVQVPAGVKAYTDQPELRNEAGSSGVVGVRQEKWVVVAPYNGTYALPGLAVTWWNTTTGKQETAKVDAVKMVVTGGQAAPAGVATPPPVAQPQTPAQTNPQAAAAVAVSSGFSWAWYAAALLLMGALLSIGWLAWRWWRKPGGVLKEKAQAAALLSTTRKPDAKAVWRSLEQACRQNQPQAAQDALVQWVGVGLNIQPALIASLRARAEPALQTEIDALNAALYGRGGAGWKGAGLWTAIQHFKPAGQVQRKDAGLADLYPD